MLLKQKQIEYIGWNTDSILLISYYSALSWNKIIDMGSVFPGPYIRFMEL